MADTGNRGFEPVGQERWTDMPSGSHADQHGEGGITGVASAVKDKAQNIASSVASQAEEAWDSTRQGVQQAATAVRDTATDAWSDLTGLMRRYPFATLGIGLGIGFCLSRLIERRSLRTFGHWDFGQQASDRGHDASQPR